MRSTEEKTIMREEPDPELQEYIEVEKKRQKKEKSHWKKKNSIQSEKPFEDTFPKKKRRRARRKTTKPSNSQKLKIETEI